MDTKESNQPNWNLFLGNLGEGVGEPKGFWKLKDAIEEAEFVLAAGVTDTVVITRMFKSNKQS